MSGNVSSEFEQSVALIRIENTPVNTLSHAIRNGLFDAIEAADADDTVKAIVIYGAGRLFIAGADMREFHRTREPVILPDLCNRIEACGKPVIAALHRAAAGGGVEIAIAAHYRVALGGTTLSMPEVNIGLMPGAGGTQRLPRLMGIEKSLEMILSGRRLGADEALACGLIDYIDEGNDPRAAGLALAQKAIESQWPVRPSREADGIGQDTTENTRLLDAARASVEKKSRHLFSPGCIVEAVGNCLEMSFEAALKEERRLFLECVDSPQREGLVHAFFVDREVMKSPETEQFEPRALQSVGVIGGGTMGAGIGIALLESGFNVLMVERDDKALTAGRGRVEKALQRNVEKGRLSPEAFALMLDQKFKGATSYDAMAGCDLIIEAVFEDMEVKRQVFSAIDEVARAGTILATNTSYLDINEIAAFTGRPEDVIGLHFFSPANIMKLLEIVVAEKTAGDVVATGFDLAKKMRKIPVRAGVCDGFIGNRILARYRMAAEYMMEDGASPYEIDQAMRDFGYPMGPFQVTDLAGGDIGWANRKRLAPTRDPRQRYVEIGDRLCERGWFGQKTGRGYYLYPEGSRTGEPDPEVLAIIDAERKRAGITPRKFSSGEIQRRYLLAMINEGAKVVAEGIALRPLDVDAALLYGYGFPRWRGGPMKYADMQGIKGILNDLQDLEKEDSFFWQPAPLLVELANSGDSLSTLNHPAKPAT